MLCDLFKQQILPISSFILYCKKTTNFDIYCQTHGILYHYCQEYSMKYI